jgi:hypothetical protein
MDADQFIELVMKISGLSKEQIWERIENLDGEDEVEFLELIKL